MNELHIYKKIKYWNILKRANILFGRDCPWFMYKTVFAKKENKYTVYINKYFIRICYWDEYSEDGIFAKNLIKNFLLDNFSGETIVVSKTGKCDILNDLNNIKTIQLM